MTTIRLRRGTAAEWDEANPILDAGELGFELDTAKHKLGNGFNLWGELEYHIPESDIDAKIVESLLAHIAEEDPHPGYLQPSEIIQGDNITVDTVTTPGSVILHGPPAGMDEAAADARYVNLDGDIMTNPLEIEASGAVLKLRSDASGSVIAELNAQRAESPNRSGWFGYGSAINKDFSVTNELPNGRVVLNGVGGVVLQPGAAEATVTKNPTSALGIVPKQYVDVSKNAVRGYSSSDSAQLPAGVSYPMMHGFYSQNGDPGAYSLVDGCIMVNADGFYTISGMLAMIYGVAGSELDVVAAQFRAGQPIEEWIFGGTNLPTVLFAASGMGIGSAIAGDVFAFGVYAGAAGAVLLNGSYINLQRIS